MSEKTYSEDEVATAISIFMHLNAMAGEREDVDAFFGHHTSTGVRYAAAHLAPIIDGLFEALPPNDIDFHDDFVPNALELFDYGTELEPRMTASRDETAANLKTMYSRFFPTHPARCSR